MTAGLLSAAASQLLVVDMQERLVPAMADAAGAVANACRLVAAARRLDVPVSASEQYPRGIGRTVAPLRDAMGPNADAAIFAKLAFSCARQPDLAQRLEQARAAGRRQLVVCGVEAHVCVLQTAVEFAARGFAVAVVADATTSRRHASHDLALRRLAAAGIDVVTAEMVMFEWLERAGTAAFKDVLGLIK